MLHEGFLEEKDQNASRALTWVPGAVVKGMFGDVKVKERYPVMARACDRCGRIELGLK